MKLERVRTRRPVVTGDARGVSADFVGRPTQPDTTDMSGCVSQPRARGSNPRSGTNSFEGLAPRAPLHALSLAASRFDMRSPRPERRRRTPARAMFVAIVVNVRRARWHDGRQGAHHPAERRRGDLHCRSARGPQSRAPRRGGSADGKTEAIAACRQLKQLAVPKDYTSWDQSGFLNSRFP